VLQALLQQQHEQLEALDAHVRDATRQGRLPSGLELEMPQRRLARAPQDISSAFYTQPNAATQRMQPQVHGVEAQPSGCQEQRGSAPHEHIPPAKHQTQRVDARAVSQMTCIWLQPHVWRLSRPQIAARLVV
jgi:hypothetical protein